jgi:hypothetical protein
VVSDDRGAAAVNQRLGLLIVGLSELQLLLFDESIMTKQLGVASDHAGLELKRALVPEL